MQNRVGHGNICGNMRIIILQQHMRQWPLQVLVGTFLLPTRSGNASGQISIYICVCQYTAVHCGSKYTVAMVRGHRPHFTPPTSPFISPPVPQPDFKADFDLSTLSLRRRQETLPNIFCAQFAFFPCILMSDPRLQPFLFPKIHGLGLFLYPLQMCLP